ncbi:MAG: hypothetical protein HS115_09260 [Spirochaetales bacterium]|nr:hypothetical protein [Spirochaetales bacterium]
MSFLSSLAGWVYFCLLQAALAFFLFIEWVSLEWLLLYPILAIPAIWQRSVLTGWSLLFGLLLQLVLRAIVLSGLLE